MIDWKNLNTGGYRFCCPECGRKDKSMGVTVEPDGSGVAHCFRCGYVENYTPKGVSILRGVNSVHPCTKPTKRTVLAQNWQSLWTHSKPIKGTLVEAYLKLRGCELPPEEAHIRFMPELQHPDGWSAPAMIALVTDAKDRHAMTIHRTWIQEGNPKALDRRLLGGHEKKGGVIRLWPDEYISYGLAIAEGIETALSLASLYKPVWSLIDAGNLAAFPVLPGIECLLIGADYDSINPKTGKRPGWDAAQQCAKRWRDAWRDVEIITTEQEKTDLNDWEQVA